MRISQRGKINALHAIGEVFVKRVGKRLRQRGLANAAGADDAHQAMIAKQLAKRLKIGLTTEQRGGCGGHGNRNCGRCAADRPRHNMIAATSDVIALTMKAVPGFTRVQSHPNIADAGSSMRPLTR